MQAGPLGRSHIKRDETRLRSREGEGDRELESDREGERKRGGWEKEEVYSK